MEQEQTTCGGQCGACCGGEKNCGGCGSTMELTRAEVDFLNRFAQLPFLPVARRSDGEEPICLEDGEQGAQTLSLVIAVLQQKRLVQVDYDLPLDNFDYTPYQAYYHKGSMALTALGQRVLEQLEIQGLTE